MSAVSSPLLETSIKGATGVLVNVTGSKELTLEDVEAAMGIIYEEANPEANIIFGATYAEDFEDEMRVTVIATGFDQKTDAQPAAPAQEEKPAAPARPRVAPVSNEDVDDIDEIFKIFNKR